MLKFYISLILLFLVKAGTAQLPQLQWVEGFQATGPFVGSEYSNGRSVAVDQQGNVYSAGLFEYTHDFDPGPGVFTLTAAGTGQTGIYISKLSPNGEFIWAIQVPDLVEFANIEIKVDKPGNVYLVSVLSQPADMDPGTGVSMLTPIGAKDAFVVKYDTNGQLVWAKQFGGPGDTVPEAGALDIDNDNNIIVCGFFNNIVDFDPGPNIFNLTSSAHLQSFIAKLNSNGDFIWAKQFGNSSFINSGSNIADVKCDLQNNIYLVGNFRGTCDFDPGSGSDSLRGKSLGDGFIAKLDAAGNFVWARQIANTSNDYYQNAVSRGIDIDANNNVYTTGDFNGTFDFDPGTNTHILTSAGIDWYILKLNEQGDFVWVDVFGGNENETGADIAVDNDGNVYAVGSIGHTADMDPGPAVYPITTRFKYGAAVLTKVNPNGGFIYAVPFQSVDDYSSAVTRRMVVDGSQNIYIAGSLGGTVDFDPGPNVYPLTGVRGEVPLIFKLSKCRNVTAANLNISACSSYKLNNEIFDSSGTYTRTIPNAAGCDSVITLHLTINKKFTQQTMTICEGNSFFAGGTNQTKSGIYKDTLRTLLNCDSIVTTTLIVNPNPLPNLGPDRDLCAGTETVINPGSFAKYLWQDMSTSSDFTVTTPGVYWVEVTNSFNCSSKDTFVVRSILSSPVNFLKGVDSICSYESLEIVPTHTYSSYQWSSGANEAKITVQQPGTYWLMVKDINGCSGTDTITVFSKQCMHGAYVPNAFTPNGDGLNDVFKPLIFGKIEQYYFAVYNQWGVRVFQSSELKDGWNGTVAGEPQQISVFVWTCTYKLEGSQPKKIKGTVTLIR